LNKSSIHVKVGGLLPREIEAHWTPEEGVLKAWKVDIKMDQVNTLIISRSGVVA
jgi:hypothetical protein